MTSTTTDPTNTTPADAEEIDGKLCTQSGPRTVAPMWARPLLTEGEWAIYTALWSFGTWNGANAWPKHQTLADRAWSERGTVINAVAKFVRLGLVVRTPRERADKSQTSNEYVLMEVCPTALAPKLREKYAARQIEQAAKKEKRDADKRKYRKTGKAASPAETTLGEGGAVAVTGVGSLHDDPTSDPRGSLHDDPRGSPPNGPVNYPLELSPVNQSPGEPPSPSRTSTSAHASAATENGTSLGDDDRQTLIAACRTAAAARTGVPGWTVRQCGEAAQSALGAGHRPADVSARLVELAHDKSCAFPTMLGSDLAVAAARAVQATRPQPAAPVSGCGLEGPFRYLDNDRQRCRWHPGHPADNCGPCRVDARVAAAEAEQDLQDPQGSPPLVRGAAAARAAAARVASEAAAAARVLHGTPTKDLRNGRRGPRLVKDLPEPAPAPAPAVA